MAGRPKHFENDELIDKAITVFWKKGYTASSAQDLLKAMQIGQGSFYRSFPGGKRELYQKSLNQFLRKANILFSRGLEESKSAKLFLSKFFNAIVDSPAEQRNKGCYLGNAIVELSNADEETKELSVKLLLELEQGFEKAIIKGQKEGEIDKDKSPKQLAMFLMNLWNGLNITERMYNDDDKLRALIDLNLQML
ncbi:TetR/AcrR family transcriptional regulator [Labilibacter marinus]|uniref:TetR/AcrR family transcriptional regulator n=1 Tax=Labilibacter marinus TaxID=1477105 RepID=UPI0008353513|nr:TetR/AcrR family transcriptional regulator [Labilibacter marinus]